MKWGQSFRIRHITTGRYLCQDEDKGLLLVVDPEKANTKLSAFCFRATKVTINILNFSDVLLVSFCKSVFTLWFSLTSLWFSPAPLSPPLVSRAGEDGGGSKARCWGDGHSRDKIRRVHVLCHACVHRPVAHICRPGCQIGSFGDDEEKG